MKYKIFTAALALGIQTQAMALSLSPPYNPDFDEPPTTPTDVRAAFYDGFGAEVIWGPSRDDYGIDFYEVSINGEVVANVSNARNYHDKNLRSDRSYTFSIVAVDVIAGQRSPVSTVTLEGISPDGLPALASPVNVRANLYDNYGGELLWDRSDDDTALQGYEVTLNGDVVDIFDALNYYNPDLKPDEVYLFTVAAVDTAGNRSSPVSVSLGNVGEDSVPSTPSNLRASYYENNGGELLWERSADDVGVIGYEVTVNGLKYGPLDALNFYDPTWTPANEYIFTVVAIDTSGQRSGIASASLGANETGPSTADTAPTTPENVRFDFYDNYGGELLWNASSDDRGVKGYEVTLNDVSLGVFDALNYFSTNFDPKIPFTLTVAAVDTADQKSPAVVVEYLTDSKSPESADMVLFTSVGAGSPLSVENSSRFLPAMFKIANAEPAIDVHSQFLRTYYEVLDGYRGGASRFVEGLTDEREQTTFTCPQGGSYTLSNPDKLVLENSDKTGHFLNQCKVDNVTLSGSAVTSFEIISNPEDLRANVLTQIARVAGGRGLTMTDESGTTTNVEGTFDNTIELSWTGLTNMTQGENRLSIDQNLTLTSEQQLSFWFTVQGTLTNERTVNAEESETFVSDGTSDGYTRGEMIAIDSSSPSGGKMKLTIEPEQTTSFTVNVDNDSQTQTYIQEWSEQLDFIKAPVPVRALILPIE